MRAALIGDNAKRAMKFQAWACLEFGTAAGIFLREMVFWDGRGMDPYGFIYKTENDLKAIGLSRYSQRKARKILKARGVLVEEKRGVPCRLYYKADLRRLMEMVECDEQETDKRTLNSNYSPTDKSAEQVRPARVPDKPDKLGRRTIQREPDRTQIRSQPSYETGLTGKKRGQIDRGVTILKETDLFSKGGEEAARLVEDSMHCYPGLDPILVCNRFRDYATKKPIKNPLKLLKKFFETEAKKQQQEPMNPHSPEGERAKSKPHKPIWYESAYEISEERARELVGSGRTHEELVAELESIST